MDIPQHLRIQYWKSQEVIRTMNEVKENEVIDLTEQEPVTPAAAPAPAKKVNPVNAVPRSYRMLRSILRKEYKVLPVATILALLIGIAYIVLPADILPDFIPFLGYVDDASILALCLALTQRDIIAYETWKSTQKPPHE